MAIASHNRRHTFYGLAAFVCLFTVAIFILWRFPPELYTFYPACPIHVFLHIECPGCGTTRALAALLHGHFSAALRLNAQAVLLELPLAAIYAAISIRRALNAEPFRWPVVPPQATCASLVIAAAFTIVRNL